jgi:chorismate mutase
MSITTEIDAILADVEKAAKSLEGKTWDEMKVLHDQALVVETDLKKEITILRQRAANAAVTIETDAEEEIIVVKAKLAAAIAWVESLEKRIAGTTRDIYGEKYGRK